MYKKKRKLGFNAFDECYEEALRINIRVVIFYHTLWKKKNKLIIKILKLLFYNVLPFAMWAAAHQNLYSVFFY